MTHLEQHQVSGTTWEIHLATELFFPIIVRNTELEHTDRAGGGEGHHSFVLLYLEDSAKVMCQVILMGM